MTTATFNTKIDKELENSPFKYGAPDSSYEDRGGEGGVSLSAFNKNPGNIMYYQVHPDKIRGEGHTKEKPVYIKNPKAGQLIMRDGKPKISSYAKSLIDDGYDIKPGAANVHGVMISFASDEDGLQAKREWWNRTKNWSAYKGKTINQALKTYSGGSYDATGIGGKFDGNRLISSLSNEELDSLSVNQIKREDPGVYGSLVEKKLISIDDKSGVGSFFPEPDKEQKMDLASTIPGVGPEVKTDGATVDENKGPENIVSKNVFEEEKIKQENLNTEVNSEVIEQNNEEDVNNAEDEKQGIDPNSVEGKQILSNTDENKNTLGGTPMLLEEGEPEDSTTSLINSIDDKKGKDIKIKENIEKDPEEKIVDTKTKLEESVDEDLEVKTEVDILKSENKKKEVEVTTGSIIADGENDSGDILKVEAAAKAEKERLRLEELANFTKSKGVVVAENKDKQGVIKEEETTSNNFFEQAGITSYTDADRQEQYMKDKLNMIDGTDVLAERKKKEEIIDNTGGDQYVNNQTVVSDRMSTYEQNVLKDINEQSNSSYATKEDYLKDFPFC